MGTVRHSYIVKSSPSRIFEYLRELENLPEQLNSHIEVEFHGHETSLELGHEYHMTMTRFGLSQRVKISVDECIRSERLTYRQSEGVFRSWRHVIQLSTHDEASTKVTDSIHYLLPFGIVGHLFDDLFWNAELKSILESRAEIIAEQFD